MQHRTITLRVDTHDRLTALRKAMHKPTWDATMQALLDNTGRHLTCAICNTLGEFTCESEMLESGWLLDVWSGDEMLKAVCPAHEVRVCLA